MASKKNRIRPILSKINGAEPSDEVMDMISVALSKTAEDFPKPGLIYVFQYYATSQGLLYDRYPVVGVDKIYDWGFTGINMHIKDPRRYNYAQVASPLYRVENYELASLLALPLEYLVQNR